MLWRCHESWSFQGDVIHAVMLLLLNLSGIAFLLWRCIISTTPQSWPAYKPNHPDDDKLSSWCENCIFFLKYLEQPEGWTTTDNWLCYPGTCFNFLEQAKTLLDSLELKNIYIRDLKQSILSRTTRKDMKNRFKKWALFGWSLRSADLVVRFFLFVFTEGWMTVKL